MTTVADEMPVLGSFPPPTPSHDPLPRFFSLGFFLSFAHPARLRTDGPILKTVPSTTLRALSMLPVNLWRVCPKLVRCHS